MASSASVGCATGGCLSPSCAAPGQALGLGLGGGGLCGGGLGGGGFGGQSQALLPALPPVGFSSGDCQASCDATLQQGYLHGFSFGNAVSCGVKQVLAIPLAAATFVGGTAEALLSGIGSCATLSFAQTTSTLSANSALDYAQAPCTCDACQTSASFLPMQSVHAQGCECPSGNSIQQAPVINSIPVESFPTPAPPVISPGLPPVIPPGAIQSSPTAFPSGVPIPRDAHNGTQSTTYVFPNQGPVTATAF